MQRIALDSIAFEKGNIYNFTYSNSLTIDNCPPTGLDFLQNGTAFLHE